ncbi:MAG: GNAT family N-acetyltransferase [Halanaerobiales bacterium]|nr:GNAT family N-acetyltransferase [Halanaerobiales bacterium]
MLNTDRLRLRQFNKKDLNSFFNIFSKKEVIEYLPFDTLSLEGAAAKLDEIINFFNTDDYYCSKMIYAIEKRDDHQLIGWVGYGPMPCNQDKLELFYALDSTFWKKGYAYEASNFLLKDLDNKCEIENIYALVDENNLGSVNVLKKLDFQFLKIVDNNDEDCKFIKGLSIYYKNMKEGENDDKR